jgi:DNA-binding NarL/FixJ family response regulator
MVTNQHRVNKKESRVFIVDDHPVVRRGLVQLINQEEDLTVCGEAEGAHEALQVMGTLQPDIAVIDISLKGVSGIELIKSIKVRWGDLPILVLSMHDESLYAERVLRAGALGYIMKQEPAEKVITAIRRVLGGEIYVSDRMAAKMIQKCVDGRGDTGHAPLELLSDRELEVFELIGRGYSTRRIAELLHVSVKTVESHREHIKKKLNLLDGTELVWHAVQWVSDQYTR